jgi:hypothetical protein
VSAPPSEPKYLVDTNVVSYFFNAGHEAELATVSARMPLVAVEEVHRELLGDVKGNARAYKRWQAAGNLTVRPLLVGSEGASRLGRLYSRTTGRDLGEYASIALATDDPSLVFVTNDKTGHWIGARELLGERVLRFWAFLRRAQQAAGLTARVVQAILLNTRSNLQRDEPLWLKDWLATLPP